MTDSNSLLDPLNLIAHPDLDELNADELHLNDLDELGEDDIHFAMDDDMADDIRDKLAEEFFSKLRADQSDAEQDNLQDDQPDHQPDDSNAENPFIAHSDNAKHAQKPVFGQLAKADAILPSEIFLLPVKERPFFPGQQLPVLLNKINWLDTFNAVKAANCKYIGLVYVDQEHHEKALPEDFSAIGTLVRIHDPKVKKDFIQLIAEGIKRFQIDHWISEKSPYRAQVSYPADIKNGTDTEFKAYGLAIMNAFRELLPLNPLYSEELKYFLNRYSASEPAQLADFAAGLTTADNNELQDVLETMDLVERMEKVLALFKQEIEFTKLQFNIRERVEESINDHQREFFFAPTTHRNST
jgi:ATP-dependent Lon protease